MARPVKHVALINKEDFPWSQKMTKKDRNACKEFIDKLCKDLDKSTDSILELWEMLEKNKNKYLERIRAMEDRVNEKNVQLLKMQKSSDELIKASRKLRKNTIIMWILAIIVVGLYIARVYFWI